MNNVNRTMKAMLVVLLMSLGACAATETSRSTGEVIDDTAIAGKIKSALAADQVTDAVDIDVEVDKARVQLNGVVDSQRERDRAEQIARETDGVASVDNNLEINPEERTAGEYVDDKVLTTRVKAALAEDPVAHALKIDVEVNRGVVSLGGHVNTAAERRAAEDAVEKVSGVVRIRNNLQTR